MECMSGAFAAVRITFVWQAFATASNFAQNLSLLSQR
jgi:hypothetical protein